MARGGRRTARRIGLAVALLTPLSGLIGETPARAATNSHYFSQMSTWLSGAATFVSGWDGAHHRVAVIRKGADGLFDGYWTSEAGVGLTCVTCSLPDATATHRGIQDVFPGGDYVLMTAEKSSHPGTMGDSAAEPGKGLYNDIYIARSDGTQAWQVTNIPNDANHGIIWPRLNATGTKVVWAEMYQPLDIWTPKKQLGVWQLKLANVTWTNGVPSLTNVQTYEPEAGNFYEPYGFSPDGTKILFASSAFMPGVSDAQIYRVSTSFTGLTRLSDQHTPGWANYNEFAFYAADNAHIIYARVKESYSGGLDYWIMNDDGTKPHRLTWANEPWSAQTRGYTNMGGWAIDPTNPNHILAGACSDLTCETSSVVSLTLTSATMGTGTGLKGEYFNDTWFWNKVLTRTDPTVGFVWGNDSPGPGVNADNYAVRWTGTVRPYSSGLHTFCTYTDDGVRLWIDNVLVIDAWYNQSPSPRCSNAINLATGPHALKMEYYDAWGGATAKLTWKVPGQSANSQEVIPATQLTPAA